MRRSGELPLGSTRLGYPSYRSGNKPGVSRCCGWAGGFYGGCIVQFAHGQHRWDSATTNDL